MKIWPWVPNWFRESLSHVKKSWNLHYEGENYVYYKKDTHMVCFHACFSSVHVNIWHPTIETFLHEKEIWGTEDGEWKNDGNGHEFWYPGNIPFCEPASWKIGYNYTDEETFISTLWYYLLQQPTPSKKSF